MLSLSARFPLRLMAIILGLALLAACGAAPAVPASLQAVPTLVVNDLPAVILAPTALPSEVSPQAPASTVPPSATPVAATDTPVPATATSAPATATLIPPTDTPVPPPATAAPPADAQGQDPTSTLAQTAVVATDKLNVRALPGTNGTVLGQVSRNAVLKLLGRNLAGDWFQICCTANQTGWVLGQLITFQTPVADLPVSEPPSVPQIQVNIPLNTPVASAPLNRSSPNSHYPVWLRMPTIGVTAPVEWVGSSRDGAMAVPSGWDNVGWWQPGTVPGQPGAAVFDGHYDRDALGPDGTYAAVFWNLHKLNMGDAIFVTAKDGKEQKFIVTAKEYYPYNNAPMQRIFGGDGVPDLNLITCSGTWDKQSANYSNRLVVYTHLAR